jgi:hypothetical protein
VNPAFSLKEVYEETKSKMYGSLVYAIETIMKDSFFSEEIKETMIAGVIDGIISSFIYAQSKVITGDKMDIIQCLDAVDIISSNISDSLKKTIRIMIEEKLNIDKGGVITRH